MLGGSAHALRWSVMPADRLDTGHVSALRPTAQLRRRPRLLYVWSPRLRQQPPRPVRAEDIREEELLEEDTRVVEEDVVIVVDTGEVEEMEVTAVAEGEAAAEDEEVVEVTSRPGRVLLGRLARLMIGT